MDLNFAKLELPAIEREIHQSWKLLTATREEQPLVLPFTIFTAAFQTLSELLFFILGGYLGNYLLDLLHKLFDNESIFAHQ